MEFLKALSSFLVTFMEHFFYLFQIVAALNFAIRGAERVQDESNLFFFPFASMVQRVILCVVPPLFFCHALKISSYRVNRRERKKNP